MTFLRCLLALMFFGGPTLAQERLSAENLLAVQDALVWTDDYAGPLTAKPDRATMDAVRAFQTREALRVTGKLDSGTLVLLSQRAEAAKRNVDWAIALDGVSRSILFLPRAFIDLEVRTSNGRSFTSEDGGIRLQIFGTDRALTSVHETARNAPGRTATAQSLDAGRSIVWTDGGGRIELDFAAASGKGAKGFELGFPEARASEILPAARAMTNTFIADPAAAPPKAGTRLVPSFVGAFRFPDAGRPVPAGRIDVEEREAMIAAGNLAVGLTATDPPPPPGKKKRVLPFDAAFVPKLAIFVNGELAFESADPSAETHYATIRVTELDPSNDEPEVLLTRDTGGAHCCTELTVFSKKADGSWSAISAGSFDGDPDFPHDLDGDGRYEIVARDNRFLNAFDCYACSTAPDRIWRLDGEELTDVSIEPQFQRHHRARLGEMWQFGWQNGMVGGKGFLAGFIGAAIRAGDGEDAWMLLPVLAKPAKGEKPGEFTARLKEFLAANGY